MPWIYLTIAGLLEIVWATTMKLSAGFTKPMPSVVTIIAMIGSFGLLSLAMRSLPLGTAYAVWTGIGAAGAFIIGAAALGEAITPLRVVSIVLILAGIAGLRIASS